MSVVFINHPLETFTPTQSGALATIIWELCRVASRKNEEPVVITRQCKAAPFDWPRTVLLEYPPLPTNRFMHNVFRVERKLTQWRHLRQGLYARRVAAAIRDNRLAERPMVLMNDPETALYLRQRFPRAIIIHWFFNQIISSPRVRQDFPKAVDAIAGVSNFTARWVERYYTLAEHSVRTCYIAADSTSFHPAESEPPGPPIIGFVGRTGIEKAPDLLLQAALLVSEQTRNFGVQIVGSNHWDRFELDAYQKKLAGLVTELDRRGVAVRQPGHVARHALPAEIRHAHIHVVPSRWDEPFALTVLEGMACGLATVASATGGTPESVEGAGLLFERDDAEGLANQLLSLISDASLRHDLASKARARALEFTWTRTWDTLDSILRSHPIKAPQDSPLSAA